MNEQRFKDFSKAAADLQHEMRVKVASAQQIIARANADAQKIQAAKEDLRKKAEALALKEKKLKYVQLRILKLLNDHNFEASLKTELQNMAAA